MHPKTISLSRQDKFCGMEGVIINRTSFSDPALDLPEFCSSVDSTSFVEIEEEFAVVP